MGAAKGRAALWARRARRAGPNAERASLMPASGAGALPRTLPALKNRQGPLGRAPRLSAAGPSCTGVKTLRAYLPWAPGRTSRMPTARVRSQNAVEIRDQVLGILKPDREAEYSIARKAAIAFERVPFEPEGGLHQALRFHQEDQAAMVAQ